MGHAVRDLEREGIVETGPMRLSSGVVLPATQAAWQASEPFPAARGKPVILLLHGYTSTHRFHADTPQADLSEGWGNRLAAPGAAIDTRRFQVVSVNHLGSCYGSTGPNLPAPDTGGTWGLAFPEITIADQARLAARAVRQLGVMRLHAIVGYSYGGYLAFEMGIDRASDGCRLVILASAPRGQGDAGEIASLAALARTGDPGRLYAMRLATLARYGLDPDSEPVRAAAAAWSRVHDATSLLRMRQAAARFDLSEAASRIPRPLFVVRARDDRLFPAPSRSGQDWRFPGTAQRVVIESGGHMAPVTKPESYAAALRAFLEAPE